MKIIVKGHQCSGNNYLLNLLLLNIPELNNEISKLSDGDDHNLITSVNPDVKYVYIHRDSHNVLKSIYSRKAFYGLNVNTFDEFTNTRYCDMYTPELSQNMYYATHNTQPIFMHNMSNPFFANIEYTPIEWHSKHIDHYLQLSKVNSNIYILNYEDLIIDFPNLQRELQKLFVYLNIDKSEFLDCFKKIGWYI